MNNFLKIIYKLLKYTGRTFTILRNTFFNIVFLCIVAVIIVALFTEKEDAYFPENSILQLSLSGDIVEERRPAPGVDRYLEQYLGFDPKPRKLVMRDILNIIESAAADPSISMILLDLKDLGDISLDQMHSIGIKLNHFKESGKKVIASEDLYSQKQYYIASFADTIILNPMGGVELHGFGTHRLYFKSLLDKLLVNYHIFRVGTYKSAIEPLIRDDMSQEAEYQNAKWLNDLWTNYLNTVSTHRHLSESNLIDYVENVASNLLVNGGDTALLALNSGLVDKLLTHNEFRRFLATENNQDASEDPSVISSLKYSSHISLPEQQEDAKPSKIALVIAEGNILGGKQPPGLIGSETLTEKIQKARTDEQVQALVLRINSGGGSAFASEIIRQELLEFKKSGKPLVVSMGSMAASGGYWIAADADKIIATPTSLTGSIGIFGAIPTFERSLDYIGVHNDGIGTTSLSAGLNLTRPLPEQLKASIQLTVNNGYDKFLDIVEHGRNINRSSLESIAEGRVFSGIEAQKIKLIDQVGYLQDAVELAAELAGVTDYSIRYIETHGGFGELFMQQFTEVLSFLTPKSVTLPAAFQHILESVMDEQTTVPLFNDPKNIYAQSNTYFSL